MFFVNLYKHWVKLFAYIRCLVRFCFKGGGHDSFGSLKSYFWKYPKGFSNVLFSELISVSSTLFQFPVRTNQLALQRLASSFLNVWVTQFVTLWVFREDQNYIHPQLRYTLYSGIWYTFCKSANYSLEELLMGKGDCEHKSSFRMYPWIPEYSFSCYREKSFWGCSKRDADGS